MNDLPTFEEMIFLPFWILINQSKIVKNGCNDIDKLHVYRTCKLLKQLLIREGLGDK